jgi:hypothetical protein
MRVSRHIAAIALFGVQLLQGVLPAAGAVCERQMVAILRRDPRFVYLLMSKVFCFEGTCSQVGADGAVLFVSDVPITPLPWGSTGVVL